MADGSIQANIRVVGLKEAQDRLEPEAVHRRLVAGVRLATLDTQGEIQERTPAKTGRLAADWNSRVDDRGNTIRGIIGNAVFYAPFVEHGTGVFVGRGLIRPRNGRFLRFIGSDGRVVFRTSIRGMEGRHMAREGLKANRKNIARIIAKHLEEGFEES